MVRRPGLRFGPETWCETFSTHPEGRFLMAWVRMDDGFATHPKVLGLSDEAFRLHVGGMCYASQHSTDGWIPDAFITGHEEALTELREASLWEDRTNGFYIHDFLAYNPSSVDRRARSESASRAAMTRWAEQTDSDAQATPKQNGSKTYAKRMRVVLGAGDVVGVEVGGGGLGEGDAFDAFWLAYPKHRSKKGARAKFAVAARTTPTETIIAGAKAYREDPNRLDEFTKDPTTWLNNGCWDDDPLPARGVNPAAEAMARDNERKRADARRLIDEERARG